MKGERIDQNRNQAEAAGVLFLERNLLVEEHFIEIGVIRWFQSAERSLFVDEITLHLIAGDIDVLDVVIVYLFNEIGKRDHLFRPPVVITDNSPQNHRNAN